MIVVLLLILGAVHSSPTPETESATLTAVPDALNEVEEDPAQAVNVNTTVQEVEDILAANPELPRLSRAEILEILDNITKEPNLTVTPKPEHFRTPEEYARAMRALMLVLPYNAKNLSYTEMKDLYTKAPITRFVGEKSGENSQTTTTRKTPSRIVISTSSSSSSSVPSSPPSFSSTYSSSSSLSSSIASSSSKSSSIVPSSSSSPYSTASSPSSAIPTEHQTTKPLNHAEEYHQPYDVQYDQETSTSTEYTTTTRRYRPNYTHRRRRPTTDTQAEQQTTSVPEKYTIFNYKRRTQQDKFSTDVTKLNPTILTTESPVSTVYPDKSGNYKTTYQYYHEPKLSTVHETVTTVYPQNTRTRVSYTTPVYVDAVKPSGGEINNYYTSRPNTSRKRTKPTTTTTTTVPSRTTVLESTEQNADVGLDLPNEMKNVLINFNIDDHLPKPQTPVPEETPLLFITPATQSSKYNSHYSASELVFHTATTQKPVMRDEVKEILASIGLYPDRDKSTETTVTVRTTRSTTTSTETPDIEAAAESFSPEMKDLLISFGLLPSANDIQHPTGQDEQGEMKEPAYDKQAASPVIDPSSYLNFKPLPSNEKPSSEKEDYLMNSDMKQFLASFGLVPSGSGGDETYSRYRSQKALDTDNQPKNASNTESDSKQKTKDKFPKINLDMLNNEMKEVLENLGLHPSQDLSFSETNLKTNDDEGHIFNPSAHLAAHNPTQEEAEKLTKLLETIKKLMKENATISQDEIDALNASTSYSLPSIPSVNIINNESEQNSTFNQLMSVKKQVNKSLPLDQVKNAPDPLSLEELAALLEEHKNEIKRQQPNATNTTTTNTTTTTDESTREPGPSLTDLAASFGGGETAGANTNVDDALPPTKPNGLYFLLDWNSFLQVQGERRTINLQFNPKLGNSRAFQPVTVP